MKIIAEITDGCVSNLARIKNDAPVPDGWTEVADVVRIDDMYDGQAFTTPAAPVIPFEDARADGLAVVYATHASYLRLLTDNATPEERDTWPAKTEAATAYLAGTATDAQTALIATEATGGGITPDELAQTIIDNATAFLGHIGQAGGLCASGCTAVKAAATHDALQAALEAFHAEVQAAIEALAGGQS